MNGKLRLLLFSTLFLVFGISTALAQQYNFYNYTVNEGLIQSQATCIIQDKQGHLWISTEGGVSRYDGRGFTHFSEANGLISNIVFSMACDSRGRIWFATDRGLSCYDAHKFTHLKLDPKSNINPIKTVAADRNGLVYALSKGKLYEVSRFSNQRILINNDSTVLVTSIAVSPANELWCGTVDKGVYVLQGNSWKHYTYPPDKKPMGTGHFAFLRSKTVVATNHGIFSMEGDALRIFTNGGLQLKAPVLATSLRADTDDNLWIGEASGAMQLTKQDKLIRFNALNGYSDNRTNHIFCDRDNNIWLATDGQGIFRYSGSTFIFYNEESGLPNPIIMSLTKGKNEVWAGTYGGGMVSVKDGKLLKHPFPAGTDAGTRQIMASAIGADGLLWVGTYGGGIFKLERGRYIPMLNNEDLAKKAAVGELFTDTNNRMWVATSKGLGYIKENRLVWLKKTGVTWGFANDGKQLLVSTEDGLFYIDPSEKITPATRLDRLKHLQIVGILKDSRGKYWLQTNGRGVLIWDSIKDKIIAQITTAEGLTSNAIYSALESATGSFWIGTGYGLNNIRVDQHYKVKSVDRFKKAQGMMGMEANKNALLQDDDGTIYYGTTMGLFINRESPKFDEGQTREVLIKAIKRFGKPMPSQNIASNAPVSWYDIPARLTLKHHENNITFDFLAINFNASEEMQYQYFLENADATWQEPVAVNTVNYAALQPGKYTFKIRARAGNSVWSPITSYPFEITAPFYQTWAFRIFVVLGLILMGILLKMISTNRKLKRQERLNAIRMEEQNKVRQKTAEDFHDEMGNKLTRITLLTDILKGKISAENNDAQKITEQIQENARELYSGTKDIIWSLNPQSDNLLEILERLQIFGAEIFQETAIQFKVHGLDGRMDNIRLPLDFSRNIIMIFKEALHNVLKYANATEVILTVTHSGDELKLHLKDNGLGFEPGKVKRGNGLNNLNIRASRIDGILTIHSAPGEGTVVELDLKIPQKA